MQSITFELTSDYIALNDLLKTTGLADSGGRGKMMVAEGLVRVDGILETRKTAKIRAGQTVDCENIRILIQPAASSAKA